MKTISTRFLKGALAMLLAVVMLFGTTITGFAAVVDNAQTSVNAANSVWFSNTDGWSQPYFYAWQGASVGDWPGKMMTKDSESGLWYYEFTTNVPSGNFKCIFNNNSGTQTSDLTCPGVGYLYTYNPAGWSVYAEPEPDPEFVVGTNLYLNLGNCTSAWEQAGARTAAYFFNNSTQKDTWVSATKHSGCTDDDCYVVQVPAGNWTGLIWVRMNGSTTTNNWNNKWSQSVDLFADKDNYNRFTITSPNVSSKVNGTWDNHEVNYSVTVNRDPEEGGTASADPTSVAPNGSVNLTATAKAGYDFVNWTTSDGTLTNETSATTATFKPSKNGAVVTANFKLKTYDFELNQTYKTPTEHQVDGAVCGVEIDDTAAGNCITHGSRKITVTPPANHKISSIKVNGTTKTVSDTSKYEENINVSGAVTIDVEYERLSYTVTFKDTTGETLSTQTVYHGDPATAPTAPAVEGHTFANWDQDYSNVQGDLEVHAVYTKNKYEVAVSVTPSTGGKVTINGEEVITKSIEYNTDVDLVAIPATGYKFVGWYLNGENKGTDTTLNITVGSTDVEYEARFEIKKVTVSVSATTGGTATLNGGTTPVTVSAGQSITLEAVADVGYAFVGWRDMKKNTIVSSLKSDTIPYNGEVEGEVEYRAEFAKSWNFTVEIPEGVSSIGYNGGTFDASTQFPIVVKDGRSVTLLKVNVTDSSKYRFKEWEITVNGNTTTSPDLPLTINFEDDVEVTPVVENLYTAVCTIATNRISTPTYHGVSITNATSAVGEKIVYKVDKVEPGYKFLGWYDTGDNALVCLSNDPNGYETTQVKDGRNIIARFYNNFKLNGGYNGEFDYHLETNSYTLVCDNISSASTTIVAGANNKPTKGTEVGGTLSVNNGAFTFSINENFEAPVTFTLTSSNNGATYVLNAEATEKFKIPVYCNIDGAEHYVGDFSASKSADFTVPGNDGMYVSSYTVTPGMEILFDGLNGHITEMPSKDSGVNKVVITPTFKPYRHITFNDENNVLVFENKKDNYKAGEPVSFKVSPVPGASIKSLEFADNSVTGLQIINNNNGTYTVSGTMPDMDVNINVESEGSFEVVCEPVYIDSFTDTPENNCKIEKKVNGNVVTDEFAPIGSTVEFTAKADKVGDATYTFIGFSEDPNNFAGGATRNTGSTYTMKAEGNKTIYAFFVRDLYLVGDIGRGWDKLAPMTYNAETGDYSYTADVANGDFILSPIANPDSSNLMTYWSNKISLGSFTGVNCSRTNSKECVLSGLKATYTLPITLTYDTSAKQVSGSAKSVYSNIYLSSGRLDYDKGGSAAFSVASNFIAYEGSFTVTEPVVHNSERYVTANIAQDIEFVRVQTTISGSMTEYYDVEYYYVYDAEHRTSTGVKATETMDKGVYEATIPVTGKNMYIVPLYFANEEYVAEFGGTRLKIVVDISDIAGDTNKVWGDFVSCYPFGRKLNDKNELTGDNFGITGEWPGQLMIPVEKNVFETSVVVDGTAAERLTGVVFNNYMTNSLVSDATGIKDELGLTHGFIQTYDYNDALHIKASGYNLITFKPKTGTDGVNHNENRKNNPDFSKFIELKDRSGNNPMDLTGQSITNPNATVGYYVRCVGNMNYQTMAADKKIDPLATGQWSVEWDIYDATTKQKLGTVMSGSMYEDIDTSPTVFKSRLAKIIGKEQSDLVGKKVMISYELQTGDTNRTDGQWYGQRREDTKYKVDVKVAEFDESLTEPIVLNPDTENPNVAAYGDAYVIVEGQPKPNAEFTPSGTSELTRADLSYNRGNGYKFKGWYRYKNGAFEATNDFGISGDTTFVAVFEKLDTNSLNITHAIYSNKKDYEILSQDGTALRSVEIYVYDKTSQQAVGAPLNSASSLNGGTASAPILEDSSYLIRLTAEPQGADTFYAWYMDATTADGKATYEEVLTKDGDELKEKVVAEFVYTYTDGMPTDITIYSDIKKVDVEGKFIYIYKNRYGTESFITKTFDMTVKEIDGFEGNEGKSRCPAYMDYTPFKDPATNKIYKAYSEAEKTDYTNKGYVALNTSNQIKEKAPNSFVTQAIYYDISWYKEIKHDEKDSSIIRVYADSKPQGYTVNAEIDGVPYVATGEYNTLMNPGFTAPMYNEDGDKFLYWLDVVYEKEILVESHIASYSPYYQYRITENKTLEAVYGNPDDVQDWTPVIESVTYTRQVSDASDYVYTDYLVAFNSSNATEIEELKAAGKNIKYGLVLVRDPDVTVNEENKNSITYPTYDNVLEDVETVARGTGNIRIYDEANKNDVTNTDAEKQNGKEYNAFYFNLTGSTVTNYNRLIYAIKYNNNNAKDYKTYAFTAYAYFIDTDNKIYISDPKEVNFYELGAKPKDQFVGQ